MKGMTKVLAPLAIVLGLLSILLFYNAHNLRKELTHSQNQLKRSQEQIEKTKEELDRESILLERQNKEVLKTKSQLEKERMKARTLQKSLTDLQKEVNELRKQNEQLQNQNQNQKKLEKDKVSSTSRSTQTGDREVSPTKAVKTMYMVGTAYTNNDSGMNGKGITATGTRTTEGRTVAVDTSLIPLGTKLEITSASYPAINGVYVAEDTGGAIKGNRLDIYFDNKQQALEFGVRDDLVVRILN